MLSDHINKLLIKNFGYIPTESQKNAFKKTADFLGTFKKSSVLIIKGYAGTGKTSMVNSIVKTLIQFETAYILMAPTGRAAKVLNHYTRQNAFTIHKIIYRQSSVKDGVGNFVLNHNKYQDAVFIVDEASMINENSYESSIFGSGNLLEDILKYITLGINCKLIMIGDTAQLPPVGIELSPALIKETYNLYRYSADDIELTDIIRQSGESGILHNATILREMINLRSSEQPKFSIESYKDIIRISGDELLESLENSYNKYGTDNVIVINRSNKLANKYNQGIRNRIFAREEELTQGDLLMVVKNNYFWFEESNDTDFIANGDIIELQKIYRTENVYGLRFADALVKLPDYGNISLKVKLLLDSISSESASLTSAQSQTFYQNVAADYPEIINKRKLYKEIQTNPYFNALQIKFAYAVTCHKAQGGQWNAAFIDQGFFNDKSITYEYLRWLYTAFTRPTDQLYLVNFPDSFFS